VQKHEKNRGKNHLQTGRVWRDGDPQGSAGGAGPSTGLTKPNEERPGASLAASPEKSSFSLENTGEHPEEGSSAAAQGTGTAPPRPPAVPPRPPSSLRRPARLRGASPRGSAPPSSRVRPSAQCTAPYPVPGSRVAPPLLLLLHPALLPPPRSPDDNNIILIVRDASGLPKPLPLVDILTKNDIAEIITNDKFLAPFDTTEDDDKTIIGDMINNGGIDSYAHYTDIARDNESPIEM